ncbi:MAG: peptidylprolyl isomerase [Desulfuromonadales bacterium]|nr:peptidylprolyl isomerase [Desulfuromonadales bacterium]
MTQAKSSDRVTVHYTGTLADGSEFDSSRTAEPLEFTLGDGQLIKGFDDAVTGMKVGEIKTVTIPAEQAYGVPNEEMVFAVERSQFAADVTPELGQRFQIDTPDGQQIVVAITEIDGDQITLDANHPLAGQDLTFELELMTIG